MASAPRDDQPPLPSDLLAGLLALARASERTHEVLADRIAPALERIAAALERAPLAALAAAHAPRTDTVHTAIRAAIETEQWEHAEGLIASLGADHSDPSGLAVLQADLARGRAEFLERILARLEASRQVHDADAVLADRDTLASHFDAPRLSELDDQLRPWLILQVQRRMRSGTVGLDVAQLAATIVERYGATREGAGLRASLPILRRCAGLCPRCGEPYAGIENACPRCLAAATPTPPQPDAAAPADEPDEGPEPSCATGPIDDVFMSD